MSHIQPANTEHTPLLAGWPASQSRNYEDHSNLSQNSLPGDHGAGAGQEPLKSQIGPLELSRTSRWTILVGVWLGTFLVSLNTTLVATLLGSISSEFESSHQAGWLGTGYLLATCAFTPLYGRLCDAMGRKGANQTALIFSVLGVLVCGLSSNMEMLIAARFVAGIGGGGLYTTGHVIASDMYSVRERGIATGISAIFNGLGIGMGGPFGGWISDSFGWRWAFLIQLPLFGLSSLLTTSSLNYATPGERRNPWEALKGVDYAGCGYLLVGIGSFLVFLSLHFNDDIPLRNPLVLTSISLGITFTVIFIVAELCIAKEPILPLSLLKLRIPLLVGVSNFLVPQCNFAVMYFFPLWFESVQLTSASEAGAHLFPNAAASPFGSLIAGWMIKKTGKYRMLIIIFGICPAISAFAIANLRMDSSPWLQWLSVIPLGFGNAVVLQTTVVALLASVEVKHIAVATGYSQVFRGIGQASAVAIASAIFQKRLLVELRSRIHGSDAEQIVQKIRHSASLVATLPPELQQSAREAYAAGLRAVFIYAAASALISFIVRLGIPEISLDRGQNTSAIQSPTSTPDASDVEPQTESRGRTRS